MGVLRFLTVFTLVVAVAIPLYLKYASQEATGPDSKFSLLIEGSQIEIERNQEGVPIIRGNELVDVVKGLGYMHAYDRAPQLLLLRIVVQGRLSECIASDASTLAVDTFFRQLGFYKQSLETEKLFSEDLQYAYTWKITQSVSQGINKYLQEHPEGSYEFMLTGYTPEPWRPADSIALYRLMIFLGLAETQQYAEKYIIESMKTEQGWKFVKALFDPYLNGFDPKNLDIIQKVNIERGVLPKEIANIASLPTLKASNNWAVSAALSASGQALFATDPHLHIGQLPPIWYEAILATEQENVAGITFPGFPGVVMGRNTHVAWGFTYGFMDLTDYYVEECKGDTCKYGNDFIPIKKRTEKILRKSGEPIEVTVYESKHGLLELNDTHSNGIQHGFYLARAYSHDNPKTGLTSLDGHVKLQFAKNIEEAAQYSRLYEVSTNHIFADKAGRIGYQQSGVLFDRSHNGMYPLLGWDPVNDIKGYVHHDKFTSIIDPAGGILASANDGNWNSGNVISVSLHMGEYRADRIKQLLTEKSKKGKITIQDFKDIQGDVISLQAKQFMKILAPLLNSNQVNHVELEKLLKSWDFSYDTQSKAATLFDEFYSALLGDLLERIYGQAGAENVKVKFGGPYFHYLDKLIFTYDKNLNDLLWKGETRDEWFFRIWQKVSEKYKSVGSVPAWGDVHSYSANNMFFSGKLGAVGKILGLDFGPLPLKGNDSPPGINQLGNRATVCQGQVWRDDDRELSFAPSWRFVTDLGTLEGESALPGGPSSRFLSNLYTNDLWDRYVHHEYKKLSLQ